MGKAQTSLLDEKALKGKKPKCPVCTMPMRCPCKGGVAIGSPKMDRWRRGLSKTLWRRLDERGLLATDTLTAAHRWVFTDDTPPPDDPRVRALLADLKEIYPTPGKVRALVSRTIAEDAARWAEWKRASDAKWDAMMASLKARAAERRAAEGREREAAGELREQLAAMMPRIEIDDEVAAEAEADAERRALADLDDEAAAVVAAEAEAERDERRARLRHLAVR